MKHGFSENIVIVTGALGALGSEIALRFAGEGATVIAVFRGDRERSSSLRRLFEENEVEGELIACPLDVTEHDRVENEINGIFKRFGRIDVLVNNAAINFSAPFMSLEDEYWDSILATNLTGTRNMCAAVSKPMMVRRGGSIVNISSVSSRALGRGDSAYAASKAAINRFTQIAAVELGRKGVRVNAVAPGLLEAGLSDNLHPRAEKIVLDRTALGRRGTAREVAEAVLFLASSKASFITGHVLTVDGGLCHG